MLVRKGNHDWSKYQSKRIYYSETGGQVLTPFVDAGTRGMEVGHIDNTTADGLGNILDLVLRTRLGFRLFCLGNLLLFLS